MELLSHGLTYLIQAIFVKNCALNSLALKSRAVFLSKAEGEGNKRSAVLYFSIRLPVNSQCEAVESKKSSFLRVTCPMNYLPYTLKSKRLLLGLVTASDLCFKEPLFSSLVPQHLLGSKFVLIDLFGNRHKK